MPILLTLRKVEHSTGMLLILPVSAADWHNESNVMSSDNAYKRSPALPHEKSKASCSDSRLLSALT